MSMIKKIIAVLQRENLLTLLAIIVVIVLLSSLAMSFFEPGIDLISGIWWSIVTLTTVGYGHVFRYRYSGNA